MLVHIRTIYAENRGAHGWPRISTPASKDRLPGTPVWQQLRAQGIHVGKRRVQRLMQSTEFARAAGSVSGS